MKDGSRDKTSGASEVRFNSVLLLHSQQVQMAFFDSNSERLTFRKEPIVLQRTVLTGAGWIQDRTPHRCFGLFSLRPDLLLQSKCDGVIRKTHGYLVLFTFNEERFSSVYGRTGSASGFPGEVQSTLAGLCPTSDLAHVVHNQEDPDSRWLLAKNAGIVSHREKTRLCNGVRCSPSRNLATRQAMC